jgi:hypothetical protein
MKNNKNTLSKEELEAFEPDIIELKKEGLTSLDVAEELGIPVEFVNKVFAKPYAQ